jgi:hypothetical protein
MSENEDNEFDITLKKAKSRKGACRYTDRDKTILLDVVEEIFFSIKEK